jgi:chromosome segregation ATPase
VRQVNVISRSKSNKKRIDRSKMQTSFDENENEDAKIMVEAERAITNLRYENVKLREEFTETIETMKRTLDEMRERLEAVTARNEENERKFERERFGYQKEIERVRRDFVVKDDAVKENLRERAEKEETLNERLREEIKRLELEKALEKQKLDTCCDDLKEYKQREAKIVLDCERAKMLRRKRRQSSSTTIIRDDDILTSDSY